MKRQIRFNIFETNSSSTHALCLSKKGFLNQLTEHCVVFEIDGYDTCSCTKLTTTYEKASYLFNIIMNTCKFYYLNIIETYLNEENIKYKFEFPDYYSPEDYYHPDEVYEDEDDDKNGIEGTIMQNKDTFLRYLFSSESFVLITDDNNKIVIDAAYKYIEVRERV